MMMSEAISPALMRALSAGTATPACSTARHFPGRQKEHAAATHVYRLLGIGVY